MKPFILVFSLLFFALASVAQDNDYYFHMDTLVFRMSEKQCLQYFHQNELRLAKLTKRMRGANNRYLYIFLKEEDALLHSLCVTPLPNSSSISKVDIETAEATINGVKAEDRAIGTRASSKDLNDKKYDKAGGDELMRRKSEARAEAFMTDAWYCFNRFENKCHRESMDGIKSYFAELDTIQKLSTVLTKSDSSQQFCLCEKENSSSDSNIGLTFELRRSELIQQYINERIIFLRTALEDYSNSSAMLLPFVKCSYYFSNQIDEYKKLFVDRSKIERLVMNNLKNIPGVNTSFSSANVAVANAFAKGVAPNANLDSKIQLSDLLKDAPNETRSVFSVLDLGNNEQQLTKALGERNEEADKLHLLIGESIDSISRMESVPTIAIAVDTTLQVKNRDKQEWRPNPLKTKRIVDRINYGSNFQFDPRTTFLPSSSTFSASISYQISPFSNLGIGTSYVQPLPVRQSNKETKIYFPTSPGYGIRSSIDLKMYKHIYLQVGYERNYRSYIQGLVLSTENAQLSCLQSGLVGLKIRYPVKNKLSRPTLEMLYDFLSQQTGQPAFMLRTGIEFNGKHALKR